MTDHKNVMARSERSERRGNLAAHREEIAAPGRPAVGQTRHDGRTWDILFCGTGGQGVLKAAEVCGWAAIDGGYHVKKSEVHGMAQRGGSVESHLRFGERVWSPLIPEGKAGFLVAFHHGEHERLKHFLAPGGVDVMRHWQAMIRAVADKRFLNTFLLGALSRYLPLSEENWHRALTDAFRERKLEENLRIFAKGREAAS